MNEEERRQEILKAEAIIQQLAKEMASASGAASQAEAARVALDAARLDVIKSVNELNEVISTQKVINAETILALNQAKKSLEDAISTLSDIDIHVDRIMTHINEVVNEVRVAAKIVETIPNTLSTALSRELAQADKSIEKRHIALMQVSENNSNKLKDISQSIDSNHRNISGVLDSKLSRIDSSIEEKHSASMQVIVETIPNMLSTALSRELAQADKSMEKRHTALMQVSENNSNKLKDISQSTESNHRNISDLLNSLARWWLISVALTLLGVWISAIILLIRG